LDKNTQSLRDKNSKYQVISRHELTNLLPRDFSKNEDGVYFDQVDRAVGVFYGESFKNF
jgi:hypothetical protein